MVNQTIVMANPIFRINLTVLLKKSQIEQKKIKREIFHLRSVSSSSAGHDGSMFGPKSFFNSANFSLVLRAGQDPHRS